MAITNPHSTLGRLTGAASFDFPEDQIVRSVRETLAEYHANLAVELRARDCAMLLPSAEEHEATAKRLWKLLGQPESFYEALTMAIAP